LTFKLKEIIAAEVYSISREDEKYGIHHYILKHNNYYHSFLDKSGEAEG